MARNDELTMAQAAGLAGYTSPTYLHKMARSGRLRTTRRGPGGVRLTTRAWLDAFLAGRDLRASNGRGGGAPGVGAARGEGAVGAADEGGWLTIPEAARRAGYASASTLYAAAKAGRLRTRAEGVTPYLTTSAWLGAYLAGLRYNTEGRGRAASGRGDAVVGASPGRRVS